MCTFGWSVDLPCAATSSTIWSSIRCALPGKLAIPLFDTSNRSNEHTYWNLRRSRTDERKSNRLTASPSPLKPAISRVHRIVIWQWGGISESSPSSPFDEFDLFELIQRKESSHFWTINVESTMRKWYESSDMNQVRFTITIAIIWISSSRRFVCGSQIARYLDNLDFITSYGI